MSDKTDKPRLTIVKPARKYRGPNKVKVPQTMPPNPGKGTNRGPAIYGGELKLTEKQESFATEVAINGRNYADAYRIAYNTKNLHPNTLYKNAVTLAKHTKVKARIRQLLDERQEENSTSRETRAVRVLGMLEDIAANAKSDMARLRAAELLGKTVGLYQTPKQADDETKATLADLEAQLSQMLAKRKA